MLCNVSISVFGIIFWIDFMENIGWVYGLNDENFFIMGFKCILNFLMGVWDYEWWVSGYGVFG